MKNKIEDLRNHLFATLEALQDDAKPMPIERAKAIADVGRVIVESAKVEVAFIEAMGLERGTGFIPTSDGEQGGASPQLPARGALGVVRRS